MIISPKNILVVGYYFNFNLGDELFIDTIPNFFKNSNLTFIKIEDIIDKLSNQDDLNKYDGIIFGGGDLINDYFHSLMKKVREIYTKPIFAFSIGIPYFDTISKGYLNYFDHVFTRNKKFLIDLQHTLGTKYIHYLPDAVMTLKNDNYFYDIKDIDNRNTIGLFLPSSIKIPNILMKLCKVIDNILSKYPQLNLKFFSFDTKDNCSNNDMHIQNILYESLGAKYENRIIKDFNRYNGQEMLDHISKLKMAICSRFHSHILCILTGTPFLSLHYANKVSLLMEEKGLSDYKCEIEIDDDFKPKDFSINKFLNIFSNVYENLQKINCKLLSIKNHDQMLCKDNYQVEKLIHLGERRKENIIDYFYMDNVDKITNKFRNIIENKTLNKLSHSSMLLSREDSEAISKSMLYEITAEISSSGVDGTINNLIEKPHHLREIVDWIWKYKRERNNLIPKFNLKTTCSQSFTGLHRSGWKFALDSIQGLHSEYGVILDVYCDATFGWCKDYPCREYGIIPYTSPWSGFFHHTPNEDYSDNNIVNSTSSLEFKQSLETCIGLFVLSEWLAIWLRKRLNILGYPNIPVVSLFHPTSVYGIIPFKQLLPLSESGEKIKIVNVGSWLRNSYSIYRLNLDDNIFEKYRLKGKYMDNYFPPKDGIINFEDEEVNKVKHSNSFLYCLYEYIRNIKSKKEKEGIMISNEQIKELVSHQISSVKVLEYLNDKEYDLLMSEYVIFVDFIECSAANTLIECMARGNPIIVNRFPSVVEYLGEEYPLYFDNIEEIAFFLNRERIEEARVYMSNPKIKEKISSEKFYDAIYNSIISENTKIMNLN